jgi:hypothetical protein
MISRVIWVGSGKGKGTFEKMSKVVDSVLHTRQVRLLLI